MTQSTLYTALSAIYGVLSADVTFMGYLTGGLHNTIAPQGTEPDYAILTVQSPGADTLSANAFRLLSQPMIKIAIMGPLSDEANIEAAYLRADALLQPSGGPLRNSGGTLAIYRVSAYTLPEPDLINSEQWIQWGGLYRVVL